MRIVQRAMAGLGAAALLLSTAVHAEGVRPQRIVSLNLCTDILALHLTQGRGVISVTFNATDPDYSPIPHMARGIPVNRGRAEEIFRLNPDLVLAGRHTARFTVGLMRRSGVPVAEIAPAQTFEDVRTNLRVVAAAMRMEKRGEAEIARFDRELARLRRAALRRPRRALIYLPNGGTSGIGSLYDEVLGHVGLVNVAVERGVGAFGFMPVDEVLRARPDIIIRSRIHAKAPALANERLTHPALRRLLRSARHVPAPSADWFCGTPYITGAAWQILRAVRDEDAL